MVNNSPKGNLRSGRQASTNWNREQAPQPLQPAPVLSRPHYRKGMILSLSLSLSWSLSLQMEVVSLPASMAMGIAKDASGGGVIISRALAVMDVTVMGG